MSEASAAPPLHEHRLVAITLIVLVLCASLVAVIYSSSQGSTPKLSLTQTECLRFESFAETKEGITGTEWIGDHIIVNVLLIDSCCAKHFPATLAVSGSIIQISLSQPQNDEICRCVCPFVVHVDIGPLPHNPYLVQIFYHNTVDEVHV
jgi:hypothetical protein